MRLAAALGLVVALTDVGVAAGEPKQAWVGYRAGNGLGWLGLTGAVDLSPRFALGLEGGPVLDEPDRGALVLLTGQLRARAGRSTPYLSFGYARRLVHVGDVALAHGGAVLNVGYQRAIGAQLTVQLAVGLRTMSEAVGWRTAPSTRVTEPGYVAPNLELGLRYRVW